jgi:prepilin-type N-terminal cleavage/methylation domain-containing protein
MENMTAKRGFTLIELLIVIGILVILALVVTLALNPPELLAQARDSQRMSDLATLNRAISYYLATTPSSSPSLGVGIYGPVDCSTQCFVYSDIGGPPNCWGRHAGKLISSKASRAVDGTGWIPVPFFNTAGGSPISSEPIDPVNMGIYFYSYACNDTNQTYQFDAMLESVRYSAGGPDDKTTNDGGSSTTIYEVGTAPGLNL